jgi:hypothetical protein
MNWLTIHTTLLMMRVFAASTTEMSTNSSRHEAHECLTNDNYIMQESGHNKILFSKHLDSVNCVKIDTYKNTTMDFYFFDKANHTSYEKVEVVCSGNKHFAEHGVTFDSMDMKTNLAFTDPETGQTIVVLKTNLTQVIVTIPFDYDYMVVKDRNKVQMQLFLDTKPPISSAYDFNLTDYISFYVELITIMILVDLGVLIALVMKSYYTMVRLHSFTMWIVLVVELLALLFFLERYQLMFWTNALFLYYFISSVLINVLQIINTSVGVFLRTSIFEKHVYQNTILIKKLHKYLGFISYFFLKLNLLMKCLIYFYFLKLKLNYNIIGIIGFNPLIWIFYFVFRLINNLRS